MKQWKQILLMALCLLIATACADTSSQTPEPDTVDVDTAVSNHTDRPTINNLDQYFSFLEEHGFTGSVLIAQDGEIIYSGAYGYADIAQEIPNTVQTVFDIASLSKQFTAVAILRLVDEGQLSVDDTLGELFDNVSDDKADITIHQLLTHSSGLPSYVYDGDFTEIGRDEAIKRALEANLEHAPGTQYLYSDTGYGLLAIIIENTTGQSFQSYLHEHLFGPAGMEHTGFYNEPHWANEPVAHAYFNDETYGSAAERPGPYWGILGFGGVLTTVEDLYLWHQALSENLIISPESTELMFTPYIEEDSDGESYYGYGWGIIDIEDAGIGHVIWHSGAADAHNSIMANLVDHNMQIIMLSNRIDSTQVADDLFLETIYASDTALALGTSLILNDFSTFPPYVEQ